MSFTENLYLKRQLKQLQEENLKLKEAMDFYTWMIDRQMKSRPKINEEMTMKQAEGLFQLAHRGLTPKQVEATHKAEHYLEKKGVEAKRVKGGFKFDGKRKPL